MSIVFHIQLDFGYEASAKTVKIINDFWCFNEILFQWGNHPREHISWELVGIQFVTNVGTSFFSHSKTQMQDIQQ